MTNKEITNNNPEKESILEKRNSTGKDKEINKKNSTQNKKVTLANKKSTKSLEEISSEIFSELILRKNTLTNEIKDLEEKRKKLIKISNQILKDNQIISPRELKDSKNI